MKASRAKSVLPPATPQTPWWHHLGALLFLSLANLALYSRVLDLGFLSLDDLEYVINNPFIEPFSKANLHRMLTQSWFANYAPMHLLSYALDVALAGGKNPWAMHLSNVLWHSGVVAAVYLLAFVIRPNVLIASTAGLLFLAHPAHVEVVAWISSRKDLIATGFGALAVSCYLLYRRRGRFARLWYAGSLVAFAFASAGKQSVVLLPAVMLVWDLLVERRRHWSMVGDKAAFGVIALFFAWQTMGVQPETRRPFSLFTVAVTQILDLWLLTGLGDYVMYRPPPDPGTASVGYRWLIISVAAAFWVIPVLLLKRARPAQLWLYYWALIQLVPPMVMRFTTPVTDRYLFLPSVGICIALADGLMRWNPAPIKRFKAVLAAPLILACVWMAKTWNYVEEWRDPRSLWYGAKAKSNSFHVCQYLGQAYHDAGDRIHDFIAAGKPLDVTKEVKLAQAVIGNADQVERLRREWDNQSSFRTNSTAYRDRLWDLAWREYEQAVPKRAKLSAPTLYLQRGKLLVSQGRLEQAIPELKYGLQFTTPSAIERHDYEKGTHLSRAVGIAYWGLKDYDQALHWYLEAQRLQQASGRTWVPTLDQETERLKQLAQPQK